MISRTRAICGIRSGGERRTVALYCGYSSWRNDPVLESSATANSAGC